MKWGTGVTYTTYTMGSELARGRAISELQTMGYRCAVDDDNGLFLVDVDHRLEDSANVRCIILRTDPSAVSIPRRK